MKKKKEPDWIKSRWLIRIYQSRLGIVATSWMNQGMLYMVPQEVLFKLFLGGVYFAALLAGLVLAGSASWFVIPGSLVLSHTLNWLTNAHFFNLLRFFGWIRTPPRRFIDYAAGITGRLEGKPDVCAACLFGSLGRGGFSPYSDLDVRVVSRDGFWNHQVTCFRVFVERFLALLNRYPLDIYMVTRTRGLEKLRSDEMPIVLVDPDDFFENRYSEVMPYESFRDEFLRIHEASEVS